MTRGRQGASIASLGRTRARPVAQPPARRAKAPPRGPPLADERRGRRRREARRGVGARSGAASVAAAPSAPPAAADSASTTSTSAARVRAVRLDARERLGAARASPRRRSARGMTTSAPAAAPRRAPSAACRCARTCCAARRPPRRRAVGRDRGVVEQSSSPLARAAARGVMVSEVADVCTIGSPRPSSARAVDVGPRELVGVPRRVRVQRRRCRMAAHPPPTAATRARRRCDGDGGPAGPSTMSTPTYSIPSDPASCSAAQGNPRCP